ncbi:hypothetical protein DH2020_007035 [Rehmannia glutinosa]|uniref:PORR domain-containing protein n=1 Tax=Rehmannia glutinosa TaxID=99300 RepID=A0ABR0TXE4_REHGL
MNFLLHSRSSYLRRCRHNPHDHIRTLYDAVSTLKCPRDRGLDHAVERERHLKPVLNLKNLIISEPSKSVPLSLITQSKETLGIPFRPIEFIRKYPSIFEEFSPGSLNIQPHIKLTPEIVSLNSEEKLVYQSVNYKQDIARRLLKLLMISRINKIPIFLLERLRWELGLPADYEKDIIPEFPDYFRVIDGRDLGENGKVLELVCWTEEFAVSELENKAKDGKTQFCLQYSKEFEMDKKYKKWVDEWQKLPYVSPYENAMHLAAKTDESDKWAVAVLHEVLNLFVGKKAERDSLLYLGEYLGLRSRFKVAFLQHPGIFYVSSKIGTHTVVLKEAYKRGMLIERHPLMDMRFKYVQLMNVVKDEEKPKSNQQKSVTDVERSEGKKLEDGEGEEEDNAEMYGSSDEDESDDDKDGFEDENVNKRGRFRTKGENYEDKNSRRNVTRRANGRSNEENVYRSSTRFSRRKNVRGGEEDNAEMYDSSDDDESDDNKEGFEKNGTKRGRFKRKGADFEEKNYSRNVERGTNGFKRKGADYNRNVEMRTNGFKRKGVDFEEKNSRRNVGRRTNGRGNEENVYKSSTRFSRRTNVRGGDPSIPRRPAQKLDFSGHNARSKTGRTPVY